MSDEPKSDDKPTGDWVMPEPVYRTSPGRTPGGIPQTDSADEIPTEPGFSGEETIENINPGIADDIPTEPGFKSEETIKDNTTETGNAHASPNEEPVKVIAAPPTPKKRGCAFSFLTVVSLIALAVIGVVIALIYFYNKWAATSPF